MRTLILRFALLAAACAAVTGCIVNDIPYPRVNLQITALTGTGISAVRIDAAERLVTLTLDETTDMRRVVFDSVGVTPGAEASTELVGQPFDLRTPLYVTLSQYDQSAEWTLRAEQTVTRAFAVQGQIGAAEIDPERRSATAYVPEGTDLTRIVVTELKLGPEGITRYSVTPEELTSFLSVRYVDILYHDDISERWALYVEPTEVKITFRRADAWVRVMWLYAEGLSGTKLGFRYRRQGDEAWTEAADEELTVEGGSFRARIGGLEPATAYEVQAYSDGDTSEVRTVTTEPELPLPNASFEEWSQPKASWLPYVSTPFWDTGNHGATTLGASYNITTPDQAAPGAAGEHSAHLQSRYVVLKFAAGNLFVGSYLETVGTNGIVGFGRPFTSHPTGLRGRVKYAGGAINRVGSVPAGVAIEKDKTPDTGIIYMAVGTWSAEKYGGRGEVPIAIDTRNTSTFFDPTGPDVIAYGEWKCDSSTDGWTEFEIRLDYRSTELAPTHLVLVCSASRYGDYFTGCDKSEMWVDDFELLYE